MTFNVPVFSGGDVDARVRVRIAEVEVSMTLIRAWLAALPEGPISTSLPAIATPREGVAMCEAFRAT